MNRGNRLRPMRPPLHLHNTPRRMRGVSLVEVLVSVVVIGIGLLGIAAMQSVALRGSQGSLETSQAVIQTTAILEAIRANRARAADYNTAGMVCNVPAAAGTLAQRDLGNWLTSLKATIGTPGDDTTCGQISGCPANCEVTVRWDDSRAGGSATRTLVTRTRI
jgi:prepilin-type N-terminal cleavage/methylation domain